MVHSDFCPPLYTNGRQHHTNGRQHHTYHYPLYPFYPWVQTMGMGMGMALTHTHKLPMKIDGYGYGYGYYPITHTQAELYTQPHVHLIETGDHDEYSGMRLVGRTSV